MCAHPLGVHMHFMPKSIIFVHINITGRKCLYVASTGIPGIVFGFLHLFYCIACGSQGVPVATNYYIQYYVMIIGLLHQDLLVCHTFTVF